MEFDSHTIELMRDVVAARVDVDIDDCRVTQLHPMEAACCVGECLSFQVRTHIWKRDLGHHPVAEVPASWWEELKALHAPEWFLKRYPVKTKFLYAKLEEVYPHFRPAVPKEHHIVRVAQMTPLDECLVHPDVRPYLKHIKP